MQVHCVEGVAIHSSPESCAVAREDDGEALTGERVGQPLSRERDEIPDADTVMKVEGPMGRGANASPCLVRRGRRPWHARTLLVREPGDLGFDRQQVVGPCREGEEP